MEKIDLKGDEPETARKCLILYVKLSILTFNLSIATLEEFSLMRKALRSKLVHTTNKVEVLRADPANPLFSAKSFEELNIPESLLKGIYNMGFSKPSRIQETALPILLSQQLVDLKSINLF